MGKIKYQLITGIFYYLILQNFVIAENTIKFAKIHIINQSNQYGLLKAYVHTKTAHNQAKLLHRNIFRFDLYPNIVAPNGISIIGAQKL
jgi:hypothetical protein